MSRKARAPQLARIDTGTSPAIMSEPFPVTLPQKEDLLRIDKARSVRLLDFTPSSVSAAVVDHLRLPVVFLALRVPFVSHASDTGMVSVTYRYAAHCLRVRAGFDPFLDLRDDLISDWAERTFDNPRSRARALSSLRRMRDARAKTAPKHTRSVASRPYTDAEFDRLWQGVQSSTVNGALMAVALIGRLGLRPGEATLADGYSVLEVGGGVAVHAYETTGVMRVVPADAETGELLRGHKDQGTEFLVKPTSKARKNLIYNVMHKLRLESPQFAHVDSHRLRHTAIVRWMKMPIPFTVVCAALGISAQSRLAADLLRFVDVPDEGAVLRSYQEWMGVRR